MKWGNFYNYRTKKVCFNYCTNNLCKNNFFELSFYFSSFFLMSGWADPHFFISDSSTPTPNLFSSFLSEISKGLTRVTDLRSESTCKPQLCKTNGFWMGSFCKLKKHILNIFKDYFYLFVKLKYEVSLSNDDHIQIPQWYAVKSIWQLQWNYSKYYCLQVKTH